MTYKIFSVYGIELEYMIVDKNTLNVKAIADKLLYAATNEHVSEATFGQIAWSNELALHVIEMKCAEPANAINGLAQAFHAQVKKMNELLAPFDACLLPTGAHPWMDPINESYLWPHAQNEIYHTYNRIFNCQGHGWANLQSAHLNLPFSNDEEFAYLHSAIRLLMPIMPALSASTPMIEGEKTDFLDKRLDFYQYNQKKIPSIAGNVVPEFVLSQQEYQEKILQPMYEDIKPYDPHAHLQEEWLNSRGAIAKFNYGAIEIRILDTQECPAADVAIADVITEALKWLVKNIDLNMQREWTAIRLQEIFKSIIKNGLNTEINDAGYLRLFGVHAQSMTAKDLWRHILVNINPQLESKQLIEFILMHGNLAERIVASLPNQFSHNDLVKIYRDLAICLQEQRQFLGKNNNLNS